VHTLDAHKLLLICRDSTKTTLRQPKQHPTTRAVSVSQTRRSTSSQPRYWCVLKPTRQHWPLTKDTVAIRGQYLALCWTVLQQKMSLQSKLNINYLALCKT